MADPIVEFADTGSLSKSGVAALVLGPVDLVGFFAPCFLSFLAAIFCLIETNFFCLTSFCPVSIVSPGPISEGLTL